MTIKLEFLGAAGNVTGSRYLLEVDGHRLLVDCGLYQERRFQERNWNPFEVPPETIEAVLLTHSHLDHCGLLPKLVRDGFHGRIYCTAAAAEIAEIVLLDAAHIQVEDAEFKKRRHEKEGRKGPFPEVPLYTPDDAIRVFPLFEPVAYEQPVSVGPGIEATFHEAGHVFGSAMVSLKVGLGSEARTIVFSGDIGRWDRPMLHDPTMFNHVDYILVESTYGDRVHPDQTTIADSLTEVINSTSQAGGNIIVPAFALERAQEILYYMNGLLRANRIPHILVFLDSPMAISITEVFKRHPELFNAEMMRLTNEHQGPFDFPGLSLVQTVDESKALNHIKGTIMIVAGAGMCNGGRIKHHLTANISRPESTIVFTGYQAVGTLGRLILDGVSPVRIFGQQYRVKARIIQIQGFSAHADQNELLRWLSGLEKPPRHVFVTHGEAESAASFAAIVRQRMGWQVSTPEYGQEVTLD